MAHFSLAAADAAPRTGAASSMRAEVLCLRPHFAAALGFSLVMNLLLLVPSLFMLQVFDRVLASRSFETLAMLLLITVGALLVQSHLDVVRARLLAAAAVVLERRLGPRMLAETLRRRAAPQRSDAGHPVRDVGALRAFLTGPGMAALFDAPWLPVYLGVVFLFHPLLGLVGLAGALGLLALAWLNERLSREALEALRSDSQRAARFADQAVASAEAAQALGMAGALAEGWQQAIRRGLENQLRASRSATVFASLTRLLRQLLQVAMLSAGAWLVIGGHATGGVMIAGTILLARALAPVESMIAGWNSLSDARAAWRRLDAVLRGEPAADAAPVLPQPLGALSVERVVFGFRGDEPPALRGVSFALQPGQSLAILGPSASGKSTLARLLIGLWQPQAGCVRLDGADIAHWPREALAPHVGYLPQSVELFAGTVAQNIARMGAVDPTAVLAAARRAQVHELILHLPRGYETEVGEAGTLLSAGQRQRIGLARALYGQPRLVVLDEPNANLDAAGDAALAEALRGLARDGVTVVLVTHRAGLLAGMDRLLVLREGRVEKFGPPAQVLAPPPRPVRAATAAPQLVAQEGGAA